MLFSKCFNGGFFRSFFLVFSLYKFLKVIFDGLFQAASEVCLLVGFIYLRASNKDPSTMLLEGFSEVPSFHGVS